MAPVSMPFTLPETLQLQETGGCLLRSKHGETMEPYSGLQPWLVGLVYL